ncbi:MAG: dihydropteroate synthase [Bacteroidales bacterium]|nr:dihydropteroate synthase [Bacteroidales bacterium]MCF8344320.1 dihydropteroate synthase [Bacteroidales bacterium]MCF8352472.1 dihydropteroate synthase [Bacteroidales bacterium]MCF8377292.1 dihydropteroate synthase [Bacteroidales bacterium]MCF8401404.1 dihydropteroate synthase [Bacteroidales bacterium]
MDKSTSFSYIPFPECKGKILSRERPLVMGILNLTPDSFYDKGKSYAFADAMRQTERMLKEGADIIDIGAVSTRPGAPEVNADEEHKRLEPVFKAITRRFPEAVLSIDTYRSEIARRAIEAGCDIINDISGGRFDPGIFDVARSFDVPYILMHMKGTPQDMQSNPQYDDVIEEIRTFFEAQIAGLKNESYNKIVLDPGFGFGKNVDHNFILLKQLKVFKNLGYPVLAGISRKSMINKLLGTKPHSALNGTTIANTLALLNGADILRVHDVKEAVQAVKMVEKYLEV